MIRAISVSSIPAGPAGGNPVRACISTFSASQGFWSSRMQRIGVNLVGGNRDIPVNS
jgi:hypothetical protein